MNQKELSFATFLIWRLSEAWDMSPSKVYAKLVEVNALDGYILPFYDVLHTLGSRRLLEDITDLVRERGGKI